MERIFVFVYPPGETVAVPAGIFDYDSKDKIGYFSYGHKYLENHAFQISPDLILDDSPKVSDKFDGLFGAFRDASPDYWGRTVFAALNKKPFDSIGEHEFLLDKSASRIGNLDFRKTVDAPEPILALPTFSSLAKLIKAFDNIQAGQEVDAAYQMLLLAGTSMGGMRPKCTIEDNNKLWIAKFPSKGDSYNVVRVEAATMTIAKNAGITIPNIRIERIAEKDIFMIERFDRSYRIEKNAYARNGFVSGLSLLGKDERDRGFGYPDFAEALRSSGDCQGAEELFKRMVFNIAIRNTDDHARNHGFILDYGGVVKLSPAYDITPTESKCGVSTTFYLALDVGEDGRVANIRNALSSCNRFGLTYGKALIIVDEVKESVSNWEQVFNQFDISNEDIEKFSYTFMSAQARLAISTC
ncbi:MAG: HipA domain-containing protein [Methylomonas sp.]|jgi:serine/threonine-protein kinase HipA